MTAIQRLYNRLREEYAELGAVPDRCGRQEVPCTVCGACLGSTDRDRAEEIYEVHMARHFEEGKWLLEEERREPR